MDEMADTSHEPGEPNLEKPFQQEGRVHVLLLGNFMMLALAFAASFLLFSLVPLSVAILQLPLNCVIYWALRDRLELSIYVAIIYVFFVPITAGCYFAIFLWRTGLLDFLMDWDQLFI